MFRPFKGTCNECNKPRYIVVRAGLCRICNEKKKQAAKSHNRIDKEEVVQAIKKTSIVQRRREPTGELPLFKEMWQEAIEKSDENGPRCRCCRERLGFTFNITFFSHLLSKGLYPAYRLLKENIWIICFECHWKWSSGSRNIPIFEEKNKEYERLKIQYNEQFRINSDTSET